jgi:hypothetical protein
MRTLIAAFLLALLPLDAAAAPGGKACQVAASAVPTPGLELLVMGSKTDPLPAGVRLTEAQIEKLADLDTQIRRTLAELDARAAKLPAGSGVALAGAREELGRAALPDLVARFLADASRDQALVIDVESAREFRLANAAALEARRRGDDTRWCELCFAVRRGMEADFAWRAGEFAALSPVQQKEAAELAARRDELRRRWAATLATELDAAQLARLRAAQMEWLKATLHGAVAGGMRALGAEKCAACTHAVAEKCEFCALVVRAVDEAKAKL